MSKRRPSVFISCLRRLRSASVRLSGSFESSISRRSRRSSEASTLRLPACIALCLTRRLLASNSLASLRSGKAEEIVAIRVIELDQQTLRTIEVVPKNNDHHPLAGLRVNRHGYR
jgi:hypothetical protein